MTVRLGNAFNSLCVHTAGSFPSLKLDQPETSATHTDKTATSTADFFAPLAKRPSAKFNPALLLPQRSRLQELEAHSRP